MRQRSGTIIPGLAATAGVAALAIGGAALQRLLDGQVIVEPLVLAILLGMLLRSSVALPPSLDRGIDVAAKEILEVAIVLLGASVDLPLLLRAGPSLAVGIVLLVVVGLAASYAIGRLFRLPHRLAVLVAAGNAICGNSAIAAVAPVIGAEREHVASAIAFTAILGVGVVIGLPLLIGPLALSDYQYGTLAGLTVYAVPQVLAATLPVSALAGQVGTLVKLVRVLMLGPVVLFFTLTHRAPTPHADASTIGARTARRAFSLASALPWFIIGFLLLAAARSSGLITEALAGQLKQLSGALTLLAMAALGLGVDLRALRKVGSAVVVTVVTSLAVLVALSLVLIRALQIA